MSTHPAPSNARCGSCLRSSRVALRRPPRLPPSAPHAQQKGGEARNPNRPSPCPTGAPPNREQIFLSHFPAHKRPVFDRAVCGFAAVDIAAVLWLAPKHFAAIQLPRTKRSFPKPRAASGWLPAAAFHPANPQAEASAKFLVPFSKKGTSFRDGNARPVSYTHLRAHET